MTKTSTAKSGWNALYRPKAGGRRVQGGLTKLGTQYFEDKRRFLRALTDRVYISDADVIEYMARNGELPTS